MAEQSKKASEEKIKKSDEAAEIKAKRELYEQKQELAAYKEELERAKEELRAAKALTKESKTTAVPDNSIIESLKAQVEGMQRQMVGLAPNSSKLMFREPTEADLVPPGEEITFTARSVLYVVASYRDYRGIEKLPPHKLIVFQYAASDIRKDGKEEQIINFSQYTTNLKTEIEFLRSHPFYGITFGENTTEMANEDVNETQYKVRAATALSAATPEVIFQRAQEYNLPNWRSKTVEQLRYLIVDAMAKEYKADYKRQQEDIVKRQALARLANNDKKE
jgi:hypothetical protein